MIDPVSAIALATGAFNTIKAGFAAGRDIESMGGDLGRWMGAVSDIKKADEYNKKPPLFKKIFSATIFAGSIKLIFGYCFFNNGFKNGKCVLESVTVSILF